MSKKECELCSKPARMFCESDEASLCWECDEKVHAANFLVAKHSRTLLCHVCHSPTPWKAAGPRLGATVSVCHTCARRGGPAAHHQHQSLSHNAETDADREYYTTDSDDDSSEEEGDRDGEEDEELDEDGENQVVPWSASPPAASSSSTEEDNVSFSSSKRTRDYAFASSEEDEDVCCSSRDAEMSSEDSDEYYRSPSSKMQRGNGGGALIPAEQASLGTAAIVEKLRRFEQQGSGASEMIIGLCDLTRD